MQLAAKTGSHSPQGETVEFFTMLVGYVRSVAQKSDEGATAVEYSILAALIAGGLVATLGLLRDDIIALFKTLMAAI
jgi:Flp pilus assembly pilin Flp